jgi:hypothetical protein
VWARQGGTERKNEKKSWGDERAQDPTKLERKRERERERERRGVRKTK